MRHAGSARSIIHPVASPLLVVAGIAAMLLTAQFVAPLGLRPMLLLSEIALAAPALAIVAWRGSLCESLGWRRLSRSTGALALLAGVTFWVASLGLLEVQYVFWQPPADYLEAFRRLHEALQPSGFLDAIVSVGAIAIGPAVCEEILFRGVVLSSLRPSLGAWGATILTALLFGLIHLDTTAAGGMCLYRIPFAVMVGLGLGALRLLSASLVGPILAHAVLNTLTFLLAPLSDDPQSGSAPHPLLGAALFLGGVAASVIVLRVVRRSAA